ncbi:MAG: hypothetical protein KKC75_06300 [Nanoarchaeota archaeon]|nr:hypothetical protein [Nanoarchaeota archaeon]MBU1946132.1 hypothetical protein [Nanoarchaeota archaeon]
MPRHNNKRYENEFVNMMIKNGHHCERIAGSGCGKESVCDCILFKDGLVYLVEVKATKEARLYPRAHIKKQLNKMVAVAKKSNVLALLAIKYKRKGWDVEELSSPIN